MTAVEKALAADDADGVLAAMSDEWLSDCTLYGSVGEVRDGVEAWFDAGVPSPILVPSSTSGGQLKAFEEVFAAFRLNRRRAPTSGPARPATSRAGGRRGRA